MPLRTDVVGTLLPDGKKVWYWLIADNNDRVIEGGQDHYRTKRDAKAGLKDFVLGVVDGRYKVGGQWGSRLTVDEARSLVTAVSR